VVMQKPHEEDCNGKNQGCGHYTRAPFFAAPFACTFPLSRRFIHSRYTGSKWRTKQNETAAEEA